MWRMAAWVSSLLGEGFILILQQLTACEQKHYIQETGYSANSLNRFYHRLAILFKPLPRGMLHLKTNAAPSTPVDFKGSSACLPGIKLKLIWGEDIYLQGFVKDSSIYIEYQLNYNKHWFFNSILEGWDSFLPTTTLRSQDRQAEIRQYSA